MIPEDPERRAAADATEAEAQAVRGDRRQRRVPQRGGQHEDAVLGRESLRELGRTLSPTEAGAGEGEIRRFFRIEQVRVAIEQSTQTVVVAPPCPTSAPVGQIRGLHERRMAGSS